MWLQSDWTWQLSYLNSHVQLDINHIIFLYPHVHFISNLIMSITVWQVPDTVDTVVCAPDDGWRYHPKNVQRFPDINKLRDVAFFGYILEYTYDVRIPER